MPRSLFRKGAVNRLNRLAIALESASAYSRAIANEITLQWGKPDDLTRLTVQAYNANTRYLDPDNRGLFAWEEAILAEFFPSPPAKVLVGACGGGRELLALAEKGYDVAGFEPAVALTEVARSIVPAKRLLELQVASYEELLAGGSPLVAHAPFDAIILGWGSLSHLSVAATRLALLSTSRALCPTGPILLSWVHDAPSEEELQVRQLLASLGLRTRDARVGYSPRGGFSRSYSHEEIFALADQSGNRVLRFVDGDYPHAIFGALAA